MNSYDTIFKSLRGISGDDTTFSLDYKEGSFGDYSTNIAFVISKKDKLSPKESGNKIVLQLEQQLSDIIEKTEVAGNGFINFYLKDSIRTKEVRTLLEEDALMVEKNGKVIVEYTDPNPFKLFHIGHLVPNVIGESIARLYESQGKQVIRMCYQGDVGMHVAKTIFAIRNNFEPTPKEEESLREKVAYLGRAYAYGNKVLLEDESLKEEIVSINKSIFSKSNKEINIIYDIGKKWSLEYFETIYKKLGTKFDYYIFESEVGDLGKEIVKKYLGIVFEESEGAVVYRGEKSGLHTRVFINKDDLPTYEAKEIGNTYRKHDLIPDAEKSIVVTGNEIDEYFKVIKSALSEIDKKLSDSITHISHGMLRLPEGKMSSRTGNIITAEDLIDQIKERIKEKVKDAKKEKSNDEVFNNEELINHVAVGAIKFAILKGAIGKDMIFDFDKSLSFDGDSGPYLQYTHARICSLLDKANNLGIFYDDKYSVDDYERELEQVINQYKHVIEKAYKEISPHHIVQYLLLLTRVFNGMYGRVQIIDENNKERSAYYVMLSKVTKNILADGLKILGIIAPCSM